MVYFQVNWNKYIEQLSKIANEENWSNETYLNKGILANYSVRIYDKISSEKKIAAERGYVLFNTVLFDQIYACQIKKELSFFTKKRKTHI